jgi:hypothetical protein
MQLNSTDNTIACMAYINIMCIKNKIQLTKKEDEKKYLKI